MYKPYLQAIHLIAPDIPLHYCEQALRSHTDVADMRNHRKAMLALPDKEFVAKQHQTIASLQKKQGYATPARLCLQSEHTRWHEEIRLLNDEKLLNESVKFLIEEYRRYMRLAADNKTQKNNAAWIASANGLKLFRLIPELALHSILNSSHRLLFQLKLFHELDSLLFYAAKELYSLENLPADISGIVRHTEAPYILASYWKNKPNKHCNAQLQKTFTEETTRYLQQWHTQNDTHRQSIPAFCASALNLLSRLKIQAETTQNTVVSDPAMHKAVNKASRVMQRHFNQEFQFANVQHHSVINTYLNTVFLSPWDEYEGVLETIQEQLIKQA